MTQVQLWIRREKSHSKRELMVHADRADVLGGFRWSAQLAMNIYVDYHWKTLTFPLTHPSPHRSKFVKLLLGYFPKDPKALNALDTSSSEVCFHWPWNKAPCSWKQWVHLLPSTVPASSGPPGTSSLPIHIVLTNENISWFEFVTDIIFRNSSQHWKSLADTESSASRLYSLHHLYLCQCVWQLKKWIGDLTDLIQADTMPLPRKCELELRFVEKIWAASLLLLYGVG